MRDNKTNLPLDAPVTMETIECAIENQIAGYGWDTKIRGEAEGEKSISNEYNGRQLFELLQNADDANSDEVKRKRHEVM